MATHRLDVPALHARLDQQRRTRGLPWRGVARETGLPIATFTRITKGRSLEADALVTLLVWLDMDTDLVWLIEPGDQPIPCPGCGRPYRPKRDGAIRKHDCQTEPTTTNGEQP